MDTNVINNWNNSTLQNYLNIGEYFSSSLKTSQTQEAVKKVIWNIGGSSNSVETTTEMFYKLERGSDVYAERLTIWLGQIALMYPSDYGYATSGGQINDRKSCLNSFWDSWKSLNECFENNYLYKSYYHQWSLTHNIQSMAEIFRIYRGCMLLGLVQKTKKVVFVQLFS